MSNYKGIMKNEKLKKFVFDFETGKIVDKDEFIRSEKEAKKTAQKARNNEKARLNYRVKKQLLDELKNFVAELENDDNPITYTKKKKPIKGRTERDVFNGDKEYTYTFNFDYKGMSIIEFVSQDIDDMVQQIGDNIEETLTLKSINELLKNGRSALRIMLNMRNVNYGNNDEKFITTHYCLNTNEAISNIKERIKKYFDKYEEDAVVIDTFKIFILEKNELNGQGSSTRSISNANDTWKEFNFETRTNCLYVAVSFCKNKEIYEELLENPKKLHNISDKLKYSLKDRFKKQPKRIFSNNDEIVMCSEYLKTPIKLYNNLYRVIFQHNPENKTKDKRTKTRDTIEVKISNNHYSALIRKQYISTEALQVEENTQKDPIDDIDTLIKKPKYIPSLKSTKYGAYDIEATPEYDEINKTNYHKAYACGLSYYHQGEFINAQFWGLDCQTQFLQYLSNNIDKLHLYTIYAHNGGKYDYSNLFREGLDSLKGLNLYTQKMVELNGRIISFVLTDGNHKIYFKDSICLFSGSLDKLTKELDVKHKKLKELVKHNQINLNNYLSLKHNIEPYLHNDCLGLLEVILKFNDNIFDATGINISDVFTASTLSKKHFYRNYYNQYTAPIYFLSKIKDDFIRKTYTGGRNECFHLRKMKGNKWYYYDFTSLYPSVAQKYLPFGEPSWVKLNAKNDFDCFFGFCDVYVRTKDFTKKPIHGVYTKSGNSNKLLFPHFKEWTKLRLFSQEIRLGMEHSVYEYKFDECDGIKFSSKPFLHQYFKDAFEKKSEASKAGNKALAQTYKIMANAGYGFWGLRYKDRESVLFGKKDDIDPYKYLDDGRLINFNEWNNTDYVSLTVRQDLPMKDFNVSIASAITSYGRMKLWELIDTIESKGEEVVYCDTDSVITSCDITQHPDIMMKFCPDGTGEALGSLKNELLDKIHDHNKKSVSNAENKTKDLLMEKLPSDIADKIINEVKYRKLGKGELIFKDIDIDKQMELDGGDLCFEDVNICGCKFYSLKKTLYNGETIQVTKLKGFRETPDDDVDEEDKENKDNKLKYEWFNQLVTGEIDCIKQKQKQWNFPKSAMVDEQRRFGLQIIPVNKKFKITYKKGEVQDDNSIKPFIL